MGQSKGSVSDPGLSGYRMASCRASLPWCTTRSDPVYDERESPMVAIHVQPCSDGWRHSTVIRTRRISTSCGTWYVGNYGMGGRWDGECITPSNGVQWSRLILSKPLRASWELDVGTWRSIGHQVTDLVSVLLSNNHRTPLTLPSPRAQWQIRNRTTHSLNPCIVKNGNK